MPKTKVKTSSSTTRISLPSVGELISDSWATLTHNAGTMVMVWVIGILAYLVVSFLIVATAVVLGLVTGINSNFFQNLRQMPMGNSWPQMLVPALGGLGLLVGVVIVLFALIGAVLEAAVVYTAAQTKTRLSVGEAITMAKSRALPLIGVLVLNAVITIGGLFLFVVPGLIFGVLLSMATYEVVLSNSGVFKSLAISAGLVKKYFWDVLGRILVLIGMSLVASLVVGLLRTSIAPAVGAAEAAAVSGLLRFALNIGISLFAIVYSTTLYKQLKATGQAKPMSLTGIIMVSLIGWIVGILLIGSVARAVGAMMKARQTMPAGVQQQYWPNGQYRAPLAPYNATQSAAMSVGSVVPQRMRRQPNTY